MPLEDINSVTPNFFSSIAGNHFNRSLEEDPVHFNEIKTTGRFWSLTSFKDLKAADADWENFSSAAGISVGFRKSAELPPDVVLQSDANSASISHDPPRHDHQRKAVERLVAPKSLKKLETLIRQRTGKVLDSACLAAPKPK